VNLSVRGLALLKKAEGFVGHVYLDAAGLPTIGYGHLLTDMESITRKYEGKTMSESEAAELLRHDAAAAENAIATLVRAPLEQHQFDALVLFVFNIGRAAFARSTLLRRLNRREYAAVPTELARWNKVRNPKTRMLEVSHGLTRRRQWEIDLWNDPSTE